MGYEICQNFSVVGATPVSPARQMRETLEHTTSILKTLDDPEFRAAGFAFLQGLESSEATETFESIEGCLSTYIPFDPRCNPSYLNKIKYGDESRCVSSLFRSRSHEATHSMPWARAPILHASPYNRSSNLENAGNIFVVCPEDMALIVERLEQDAYAKQSWMDSLFFTNYPEWHELNEADPVNCHDFRGLRMQHGYSLVGALVESARRVSSYRHSDLGEPFLSFADYYQRSMLQGYDTQLSILLSSGVEPVYVRMEESDLLDIGRSFGPNIFESGAFPMSTVLSGANADRVNDIRKKLNVPAYHTLPSFSEALAKKGLSRSSYLALSKGQFVAPRQACDAPRFAAQPVVA